MTRAEPSSPPPRTLARRLAVTASFVVAIVGSAIGAGALGGVSISEAADGLLASDATLIAPAGPAFSIWTVIYAALGAYTLWQWWDRADERRVAGPAIASLLLNAAWILLVQAGRVGLTVPMIVLLVVVLAVLFQRASKAPARGPLELLVVDGTFGLYLGWVSVATCANITAALVGAGAPDLGHPEWLAVLVLAVAGGVGIALASSGRGAIAAPVAISWGIGWIAVARSAGEPHSPITATAATIVAVVVGAATVVAAVRQLRRSRSTVAG
ncbi:hypothetical protein BH708_13380 [Brachybacterium sp. P6-10-X1]|uniref:tryptophan-rich sensory protein n=1 Tax=Brachybacterium sp. P6-10-X1 TaxID=1903186 RepID=UPI00097190F5|nr:tryptophan-rich sensory protein [Brachybacterium sp. P6-10-X1]APX33539.1 hypothetical protein BH708_13380 [Brachybacterium sp. P6-10-X1]